LHHKRYKTADIDGVISAVCHAISKLFVMTYLYEVTAALTAAQFCHNT